MGNSMARLPNREPVRAAWGGGATRSWCANAQPPEGSQGLRFARTRAATMSARCQSRVLGTNCPKESHLEGGRSTRTAGYKWPDTERLISVSGDGSSPGASCDTHLVLGGAACFGWVFS
jgi:hypothetical protein